MKIFRNPYWSSELSKISSVGWAVSSIIKRENFPELYRSSTITAPNKEISEDALAIINQLGEQTGIRAGEIFIGQMIVLLVTYLELMISEYLEVLFAKHPMRMHEFLISNRQGLTLNGKVDLQEIINAESKDEIIDNLSKVAAMNATFGKFEVTLARLERLSNSKIRETQRENLLFLVEYRNKIVHEAFHSDNDDKCFFEGNIAVISFLSTLIKLCELNELPHGSENQRE
jgi:hypothetical protein